MVHARHLAHPVHPQPGEGGGVQGRVCEGQGCVGGSPARAPILTPAPPRQNDVEDSTVALQGDEQTIRSVLDTLTCSCMQ